MFVDGLKIFFKAKYSLSIIYQQEEDALISEWQPEPLVPKQKIADYILNPKVVHG